MEPNEIKEWSQSKRVFADREEIKNSLNFATYVRSGSQTKVILHCGSGPKRDSIKIQHTEEQRNKPSKKEDCPWRLNANYQVSEKGWIIMSFHMASITMKLCPKNRP